MHLILNEITTLLLAAQFPRLNQCTTTGTGNKLPEYWYSALAFLSVANPVKTDPTIDDQLVKNKHNISFFIY